MPQFCRSCRKEVVWITTVRGQRMICDATPLTAIEKNTTVIRSDGNIFRLEAGAILDHRLQYYEPHWASCKDSKKWRRK